MHQETLTHEYRARLGEKAALLDRFSQVTTGIKAAIETKEIERIASHIEERQGIINRIESIDGELQKLESDSRSSGKNLSGKAKGLIANSLRQVGKSLERLADMDRECVESARAAYDSMKSEILGIRSGLQATRGYGRTQNNTPRFLDLKR
jgi:hypothetical protein